MLEQGSMDDIFEALTDVSRRQLLLILLDERSITVDWFVGTGHGVNRREVDVRTELYHNHLPKLADDGFIRWQQQTGEIERGSRFDEIAPILRFIADQYGY